RVFQDTREISRFLFGKIPCDGSAPTVNGFTNLRRGLDLTIKDDGETFANVSLGQFPERCRAFGIELQCYSPALLIKSSEALSDTVAQQIGSCLMSNFSSTERPSAVSCCVSTRYPGGTSSVPASIPATSRSVSGWTRRNSRFATCANCCGAATICAGSSPGI